MTPGMDFVEQLDTQVGQCSIFLAMIGSGWLNSSDETGGRRLDDPKDFVRIEIASALRRNIPVIPVLMDGATLPRVDELPDELKPLVRRHALELRHSRFGADADAIVKALKEWLPQTRRRKGMLLAIVPALLILAGGIVWILPLHQWAPVTLFGQRRPVEASRTVGMSTDDKSRSKLFDDGGSQKLEIDRAHREAALRAAEALRKQAEVEERTRQASAAQRASEELVRQQQRENLERERLETQLVTYVTNEYLRDQERFTDVVDYYDKGQVTREFVVADKKRYAARWPTRSYLLVPGSLRIRESALNRVVVVFDFTYQVANPTRNAKGTGTQEVVLVPDGHSFLVAAVREVTRPN